MALPGVFSTLWVLVALMPAYTAASPCCSALFVHIQEEPWLRVRLLDPSPSKLLTSFVVCAKALKLFGIYLVLTRVK